MWFCLACITSAGEACECPEVSAPRDLLLGIRREGDPGYDARDFDQLWLLDDWMLKKLDFYHFGLHELPSWKLRCFRRTKVYAS